MIRTLIVLCSSVLLSGCALNHWDLHATRHFNAMNHAQEDIIRTVSYHVDI